MFFSLFLVTIFTRFYGLGWGNGFFFHPDENNMAVALSNLTSSSLNPHFFAYGQFPLYLGYLTLNLFNLVNTFSNSVFVLRFFSAVFSCLSVFVFYLIAKRFTSRPIIPTWLFVFTPGLIQLSHYGTTESLLVLVFLSNIYLALKISTRPQNYKLYILVVLISGIGIATKISAIFFLLPVLLAIPRKPHIFVLVSFLSLFIALILSPYNLIAKDDFLSSMTYETRVATGAIKVFYTTQFEKTVPYLFQFVHIFPYIAGVPIFILSFFGLIRKSYIINHKSIIVFLSSFIYLLYFGQLYVKWTRFMSPIFFIFPLLAGLTISRFKYKYIRVVLTIICIIPGLYFMNNYVFSDTRVQASQWIKQNIGDKSYVFSESGNVVNIPEADLYFDFYNLDYDQLAKEIYLSDYIIIPSRRVFKNGIASNYYQNLFNGHLGFAEIKTFSSHTNIILNPESAEETWSVFDQPTVRIYKKSKQLSAPEYETIFKQ